jgi:protein gp37
MTTGISWTGETWNPWVGCELVSPGCTHCYAMADAWRISNHPTVAPWYRGTIGKANGKPAVWTGSVHRAGAEKFNEPLHWRAPRLVFVNSMSDFMLGEAGWRDEAFEIMRRCRQHRFQILTKRAELLPDLPPLPGNVWLGVSIERQDFAWRLDHLRAVDAAIRFVSAEPLLGPLDLDLAGIDWLIAGAESAPGKRPGKRATNIEWVRSLRDQCQAAGVRFWLKQLVIDGKLVELPELDGRVWQERPLA